MSNIFRQHFVEKVSSALVKAQNLSQLDHQGLKGRLREILAGEMISPILPPEVQIGTGKLVAVNGAMSNQTDIILYSRSILPPAVYNQSEGFFPVESCLYTIEVKSKLTVGEVRKAIQNAQSCFDLDHLPTRLINGGTVINAVTPRAINIIFAFDTDLALGSSDMTRYLNQENAIVNGRPAIQAMCVVGRGYWAADQSQTNGWGFLKADGTHNEIMRLLTGIANTLPQIIAHKGKPVFGHYIA